MRFSEMEAPLKLHTGARGHALESSHMMLAVCIKHPTHRGVSSRPGIPPAQACMLALASRPVLTDYLSLISSNLLQNNQIQQTSTQNAPQHPLRSAKNDFGVFFATCLYTMPNNPYAPDWSPAQKKTGRLQAGENEKGTIKG